jgi:hypothetical protein
MLHRLNRILKASSFSKFFTSQTKSSTATRKQYLPNHKNGFGHLRTQ